MTTSTAQVQTGPKGPPKIEDSPALASPEWLPAGTDWEELDEMRATHLRLLQTRFDISQESLALGRRFEAEEQARSEALQASMREGTEPDLPDLTPPEEREAELAAMKERSNAVNKALDNFLREVEQRLEERGPEWLADLDKSDAEAMERWEEAKRIAAEALAEVSARKKLRMWIEREAGTRPPFRTGPARHFPYGQMADPPVDDTAITPEMLRGGIQIG